MGTSLVVLASCHAGEKERALREIASARGRLAALARSRENGSSRDAIAIARTALLDAEHLVRRERRSVWDPELSRALDKVVIAAWVAEREARTSREEAEAWLQSASAAFESARRAPIPGALRAISARLGDASLRLGEARTFLDDERFDLATERARQALTLAGEQPEEVKTLAGRFGDPSNLRLWHEWVEVALDESRASGRPVLVVDKRAQVGILWSGAKPMRWFAVDLGYNGWHRKLQSGDGATPEGLYRIVRKKGSNETRYHKALLLDYPNEEDRQRFRDAKTRGSIAPGIGIGGLIEIHGEGGRGDNWTDGCVALANDEMDLLFDELSVGSAVVIVGSYEGTR